MIYATHQFKEVANKLRHGKIGVIPTDTIYGIVTSALNSKTVEKIYHLRKRNFKKPMIILISDLNDLNHFNIRLSLNLSKILKTIWPNPVSVILECPDPKLEYLHRGTNSLAFRIPNYNLTQKILNQSGPLVAPSANFEGQKPAQTIAKAIKYFGSKIDFYLDDGKLNNPPSTVISLSRDGKIQTIRRGGAKLKLSQFEKLTISKKN